MRTTARIERIDHPILDAGGVGECLACGRICTVEELLGTTCPCGVCAFTRIPRLTTDQKTVRVVVIDDETKPLSFSDLIDDMNAAGGIKDWPPSSAQMTQWDAMLYPASKPNPVLDQICIVPLRFGRLSRRAKRRARYNTPV